MTIPSSMHETLVFFAPMSMTQAFEMPAPKLAQIPSYTVAQYLSPLGEQVELTCWIHNCLNPIPLRQRSVISLT